MAHAAESGAEALPGEAAQLLPHSRVLPEPRPDAKSAAAAQSEAGPSPGGAGPGLGGEGPARWGQRVRRALARAVPLLEWGARYRAEWLAGDVVAGLTIASLAVPQDLGYASLARVPGQHGLYASVLPPVVYAALGTSRHIAIGPTSVVSLLLAALIQAQAGVDSEEQPTLHVQLALTCTLFAGVWQAAMGALGLGFLLGCLSHAVIVGFMAGAALAIALQQLKGLLGFTAFTAATDIVGVLHYVARNADDMNWRAILIALSSLAFLASLRALTWAARGSKAWPAALLFLGAMGPMLTVLVASLAVWVTGWDRAPASVPVARKIPQGLPPLSSASQLHLTGPFAGRAALIGFVVAIVALTEAIAIARTFAAREGYRINCSQELVAYGAMNVAAALTSGIATTGSFSRSAVNHQAGARTMLSNIVMSGVIVLVLLLITDIFQYVPSAALSAVIINAVLALVDIPEVAHTWHADKQDFLVLSGTFLGTIFASVELGILVGVCTSAIRVLPHARWLHFHTESGSFWPSAKHCQPLEHEHTGGPSGILALRLDCPLFFTTAESVAREITDAVEQHGRRGMSPLAHVLLDLTCVPDIDTTGLSSFKYLMKELEARGLRLALANPSRKVLEKLQVTGVLDSLGRDCLFLSAEGALELLSLAQGEVELEPIHQVNCSILA